MYHRIQHSGIDALGMAAEPRRRWVKPPEAVVVQKHILVNVACDNIIGARFIEIVVEFFGIKVGSNRSARHSVR